MSVSAAIYASLFFAWAIPYTLYRLTFRPGVALLRSRKMVRRNYRGEPIPTGGGLLLSAYVTITLVCVTVLMIRTGEVRLPVRESVLFLTGSCAIALWGYQDDRSTEVEVKGFRGHFRTLLTQQRMTSGLLKFWGGGATSLIISLAVSRGWAETVVHTLLLALSANLINLFDLRPGRAIKVFWLAAFLLMVATPLIYVYPAWIWYVSVLVVTLLYFRHDARGELMLGDTGANYLGFLLGFAMMAVLSFTAKLVVTALLILLHVAAELVSFSRIIRSVSWLRLLDRWGVD